MNIVIADDEQIILKWMKKNIEELSADNHVVNTCFNGKQVLNCCLNQKVDVLFTDIRMPVMGGIELLKKLSDNQVLPYTIILSAHDDFSYARDCFKLGVREFLLKSEITKESLEKCLKTAKACLESAQTEEQAVSKAERWESLLRRYFQKAEEISRDDMKTQWGELCEIEGDFFIIKIEGFSNGFQSGRFREVASFLFQEEDLKFYCVPAADKEIVILSECPHESIKRFIIRLYQVLASFGYDDIRMSASDRGSTWEDLDAICLQAEEVHMYQSFYLQNGGADYVSIKEQQKIAVQNLEDVCKSLEEQIISVGRADAALELRSLFQSMKSMKPAVSDARQFILNYLFHIYWNYLAEDKKIDFPVSKFIELSNCSDIDALEKKAAEQTGQFLAMLEKERNTYSKPVHEIIRYVEEHYETAISLEELANYVHMNRSYISHLFKKETGVNIYQYLLEFRMEKAKLLLLDNEYSVQQVCRQIGISDSAYFSKLFKKHVGMSPLEFRKMSKK